MQLVLQVQGSSECLECIELKRPSGRVRDGCVSIWEQLPWQLESWGKEHSARIERIWKKTPGKVMMR